MLRYIFIWAIGLLLCFSSSAQNIEFRSDDWQDPAIFEKGQTQAHAFHVSYSDTEAAILKDASKASYQLLNGTWKFKLVNTPAEVPDGFWTRKFRTKDWDDIAVPSDWQMMGFGHPKFRNVALSFESNPPHIPDYYNPTGCYKQKFSIPSSWKDKEVFLRFEGIKSASYVWVNGERVGYNQGGFEPAEYNITRLVKPGKNDLSVEVIRFCDGSYLENQDMWRLSGIYRDVKLYAQPKLHIADEYVVTDLDNEYKNAKLEVELTINNASSENKRFIAEVEVLNDEKQSILSDKLQTKQLSIDASSQQKVKLEALVLDPLKWSDEFPKLYTIVYSLKDESGRTIEAFTKRIGFREVEYTNNILTINGVPVKFNGVNSHMHHPDFGQAVPLETLRKDLTLMKQYNINCVRTCHYPPTPEYLDLADELGVYIFAEVGDEAHSNTWLSSDSSYTEMYRDRSRKLVYRDRNHPSVVVWSAGNESGSGFNIHEVIKTGKAIDHSRPAWMYGGNRFYIPFEDLTGPRYWIPLMVKNLAEGKVLPDGDTRSSFMDEYLAATGNGLGGLDEYWELIRNYPRLTGGAIWDWISPGITTPLWIVPDRSSSKNDGAIMGRPTFVEGIDGRALEFSGHDDWVEFYRDPGLDIDGKGLSISFWVKPFEIPQPNTFITKGQFQFGIIMSDPQTLEFYVYNRHRYSASAKVDENWYNNWHQVSGIYNGENIQLWVDGKLLTETPFKGTIHDTPFPLCIGRNADTQDQGEYSGRMSNMIIDDVKVFDRAVPVDSMEITTIQPVLDLDFESDSHGDDFYAIGLGGRTYGIVWPDRRIQPEIHQIKKAGQPVKVEASDLKKGLFKLTNYHLFKNLSELDGSWEVQVGGQTTEEGILNVDLPAQQSKEISIPYHSKLTGEKAYLFLSFKLKDNTGWAKAGHEVAWEQFEIPVNEVLEATELDNDLKLKETEREVIIEGYNFSYKMDKTTGTLSSINYKRTEYLQKGPEFTVWRVPTSNDMDPWGAQEFEIEFWNKNAFPSRRVAEGNGRSIDNQLRTLGLDRLETQVDEINVRNDDGYKIIVKLKAYSNAWHDGKIPMRDKGASAFERNEVWTFYSNGRIDLEQEIIPHGPMPSMLPKIGLEFELAKDFSQVDWFGRGPFETYPDRKTGARFGMYHSTAEEMYEPYIIPQEYGNRTDVSWLKVKNSEGRGLKISAKDLLNFSLHNYSTDNLSRAMYTYQLKDAPFTTLCVDYETSGVGATAIRQMQKYQVKPEIKHYRLTIEPF